MDYFNTKDYVDYLIKNFNLISKGEDTDTTRPDISVVDNYLERLSPKNDDKILEIGCGLGRLLDWINSKYKSDISGIDICSEAIQLAKNNLPKYRENLHCSPAESLPYQDNTFDIIIIWGVFDLTQQDKTLKEMSRVLKQGGRILLTGRSTDYHFDDEEAKIAEVNIIKKGIPIHYTDFNLMKDFCAQTGLQISYQELFERRGDFANLKIAKNPQHFYEFLLVLTKIKDSTAKESNFYSKQSRTLGDNLK